MLIRNFILMSVALCAGCGEVAQADPECHINLLDVTAGQHVQEGSVIKAQVDCPVQDLGTQSLAYAWALPMPLDSQAGSFVISAPGSLVGGVSVAEFGNCHCADGDPNCTPPAGKSCDPSDPHCGENGILPIFDASKHHDFRIYKRFKQVLVPRKKKRGDLVCDLLGTTEVPAIQIWADRECDPNCSPLAPQNSDGMGQNTSCPILGNLPPTAVAPPGSPMGPPPPPQGDTGQKSCGGPVNISNGAMWDKITDFSIPGRTDATGISLTRTYTAIPAQTNTAFGAHWQHNFETKITPDTANLSSSNLDWIDESGGSYLFTKQSDGSFKAPPGLFVKLTELSDHYELRKHNNSTLFFFKPGFGPPGRLYQILDPHGEALTLTYNSRQQVSVVSSPFAGTITFSYGSSGLISQIRRDRDNLTYTYAYDSKSRLKSATDYRSRTYEYCYVGSTPLPGPGGHSSGCDSGPPADPAGPLPNATPGQANTGLLESITDPLGRVRHFSYDDKGRANNQYDPGGGTWKFVYGTNATTVTQPNGSVSQFSFDNTGHEIKSVDPTGDIKYKTWANGLLTDERDEFGGTTHWDYDANGNTTSYKRPEDSATKTTSYDLATNLPKVVTPVVGAATQFTIAPNSVDVIKVQRGNLSISYSRDAFGNVLSTDNGQAIYSVQRDSNGLITHTFDLHNPASMTYDIRGRVTSMNYLSGRILTYTYNDDDQVLSVSDSHGPSIANTYDLIGRLVQKTVSAGSVSQSTLFKYDDRDRLVETTDALHRQTIFSYDSQVVRDKPVSIQDPAGRITSFQYDALNRLVAKTDPLGAVTSYAYDLRGNLTGVTDASGNQTTYIYDKNDRRISEIRPSVGGGSSPVFRRQDYFYDSADHLVKEMINGHRELNYSYDSLDRLVEKDLLTDGSPEDFASFSYENQLDAVLLRTANNSIAHLSFAHESAPPFALSSFGVADGGGGHYLPNWGTYSIARDVTGEIASVSGSGGIIFSKSYDPAGRLTGVASGPFSSSIGYDGFGRRQSVVHSDGASGGFQYDLLNRITNVAWSGPTPISEALSYDVAGNITNIQRENGAYTVAYDAVDQLVSSTGVYNRAMQYDLMGNRIQDSVNGVGHFVSNYLTDNGSFRTYAPDPNGMGNLATQFQGTARKNYKYRADDRLREYDDSSANIQHNYYYDALGRRAVKDFSPTGIGPGFTQSYVYLGEEDRILMGKSGDGTVTAYLDGQGIDDHLAEVSSGAAKGYVTDHLGSVLNSDAAGAAHSFGLFGETANVSESASAAPLHYGFAGRQLDGESSTYFNRARNYNPLTGTWLSQDPIGYASGDANYYRYAMGNPLRFTDPSGLANAGPGGFGQVGGDEGVQLLVDYYHGQAASGAPVNQNQAEWAHAIAVNDRNTAGPQNMNEVQAATEHYLWSNSEVLNGGTLKSIAYDFLPEGYQLAKLLGFFPDATPASQLELKWGQKGSNDAYNQKTSCP